MKWYTILTVLLVGGIAAGCSENDVAPLLDNPPALTFAPDTLPAGTVGEAYAETLTVTRNVTPVGGISVSDGALPQGLILTHTENHNWAVISGTAGQAGTAAFIEVFEEFFAREG